MAVIVDNGGTFPLADTREAPFHAAEIVQSFADGVRSDAELARDRDGGDGVGDIVLARHGKTQIGERNLGPLAAVAENRVEMRGPLRARDVYRARVGLRTETITYHAPVADGRDHLL